MAAPIQVKEEPERARSMTADLLGFFTLSSEQTTRCIIDRGGVKGYDFVKEIIDKEAIKNGGLVAASTYYVPLVEALLREKKNIRVINDLKKGARAVPQFCRAKENFKISGKKEVRNSVKKISSCLLNFLFLGQKLAGLR